MITLLLCKYITRLEVDRAKHFRAFRVFQSLTQKKIIHFLENFLLKQKFLNNCYFNILS